MSSRADRRPNPEEVLRRVQADENRERRGRLKVFLGYASRVGKSFRMFDEGRRRKERGQDVVVGALQSGVDARYSGDPLGTSRRSPPSSTSHAGRNYEVIDMAALFRRHPEVCLIDGLAYDNPPGSRNPQRWQDVGRAARPRHRRHHRRQPAAHPRAAGRGGAHHRQARGQQRAGSVPHEADEIEVVDAPPDALLDRIRADGSIPDCAPAWPNCANWRCCWRPTWWTASCRNTSIRTEWPPRWGAQERILVCLTPRSNAGDMLRSGQRNALRFHGALLAAYVEQPGLAPAGPRMLEQHLALAREMGAEVHCLQAATSSTPSSISPASSASRSFSWDTRGASSLAVGPRSHRPPDRRRGRRSTSACSRTRGAREPPQAG